jgi:hypothetical protein
LSFFSRIISLKPKICANCKYLIKDFFEVNTECKCSLFPKMEKEIYDRFFLNDGGILFEKRDYHSCKIVREYDTMCGKEGNLYEEKEMKEIKN